MILFHSIRPFDYFIFFRNLLISLNYAPLNIFQDTSIQNSLLERFVQASSKSW